MNRGHKSPSQLLARSDPHAKFLRAHRWSLQGREAGRVQDCGSLRSPEAASQDLGGDGGTTGGLFDATCILYPLACLVSRMCKRVGSAKVGAIYVHFPPLTLRFIPIVFLDLIYVPSCLMPGLIPRVSMDEARRPRVIMCAFVRKFRPTNSAHRVQSGVGALRC